MQKLTKLLFIASLISILAACGGTGKYAFIASPNEPHGLIITGVDMPGQYLYAVKVDRVDGQQIPPRETGIWLKPGKHTIDTVDDVNLNRSFVPGLRGDRSFPSKKQLELDIEAGKIYYVALKADGSRRSEWGLVVWKVEDQKT